MGFPPKKTRFVTKKKPDKDPGSKKQNKYNILIRRWVWASTAGAPFFSPRHLELHVDAHSGA